MSTGAPVENLEKETAVRLKNYHLPKLVEWLNIPLHGQDARVRNRFLKVISPRYNEVDAERVKLLRDLSEKDEKGEPKTIEGGRAFDLTPENREKFAEQMSEINSEEFVIDVLESNRKDLKAVRQLLLGAISERFEFDIRETDLLDEICQAFEKI